MNVSISDLTSAFAAVNLAGPKARTALTKVCDDIDLSPEGFRTWVSGPVTLQAYRVAYFGSVSLEN